MYRGDIRLGDTIDIKFTTRSFTTGAPTTLAGTPVISAYPGNSTTQLTAGITLTVDFDTVTGLHNVRVVATSGNGYATATNYDLVITTGTVGGVSVVGEVIGSFSIEARSAVMPTVAARTLDVSATGEAGVDWANVGSPTTALALTGTTIATTQKVDLETIKTNPVVNAGTVTFPTTATLASTTNITAGTITTVSGNVNGSVGSVTGAVGSVTGNVGGNVTGSVGSVVGAVGSVTGAVGSVTGAVGSVTGNVGGNVTGSVGSVVGAVGSVTGNVGGNVTGSVGSVATGGIAAASFAANAINAAALAADAVTEIQSGLSTLDAAGVRTAVGLASANLDTQLAALPTADENADALLGRNVSGGSSTGRTVKQALHVLRNKSVIGAGTLTVYDTDDTTTSFTATVTTAAGDPISGIDPA